VVQLAEMVRDITGLSAETVYEDVAEGGRSTLVDEERMRLPSELKVMCMSPARAKELVGWEPEVQLREGLEREWKWLADHGNRWQKMSY
jgi:nucleoside-diphosphate-sugar epimerase